MTIKKQLNIGLLLILILFLMLLGINFFAFQKIKKFQNNIETINKSATHFYKQRLGIDSYSKTLTDGDYNNVEKDLSLSFHESSFIKVCDENSIILADLEINLKSQDDKEILGLMRTDHEALKTSFNSIKQNFLSSKIAQENKNLNIFQITQKRENIKNIVFSNDFENASSSADFFFSSFSTYESIEKQERTFLNNGAKKSDLDVLLKHLSDFEKNLRSETIFNESSPVFLEIVKYRNELDSYFISSAKVTGSFSLGLEGEKLDNYTRVSFFEEGYANKLINNQKKSLSNFLWIVFFLNIFIIVLLIFLLVFFSKMFSKKVYAPISRLVDFSHKIGEEKNIQTPFLVAEGEFLEIANALIGANNKLNKIADDLNSKVNEVKIKENLESLIEALSDGVVMYDKDKKVVLINSSLKRVVGIESDTISLKNLYGILSKHNLEFHIDLSLKTNDIYKIDNVDILGRDYEITITQVSDYSDEIVGGVIIFHAKEKDTNNESKINHSFDLKSLISSHFGTPLSYIKLFTGLLSSGEIGSLNKEQNETVLNIHHSAEEMKNIIDKLKEVAVLDSHELEINTEEIVIVTYLKEVIKSFCQKNNLKDTDFIFKDLISEGMKINIDKTILKKSLEILFDNALIYGNDENRIIEVELKELGFNYLISIKDNGIGISDGEHSLIFEKFFRASNSIVKNSKGSGLSLYLAKKQLNATGAELFFESKEGLGSTFFIEIPKGGMRQ